MDIAGGESDAETLLRGCFKALSSNKQLRLLLVGDRKKITPYIEKNRRKGRRITIIHTEQVIGMDEEPARACLAKPEASVILAARAVREGQAVGFYSPGNTGAAVAASVLQIGLLPGLKRPVIAAPLPALKGSVLLLDVGACVDIKPDFYPHLARLGSIFMERMYGVTSPRVALLNMGTEAKKGPQAIRKAHKLLTAACPGFIGNIEGMEIPARRADVVVCDGFVGNIVLKLSEGFGSQLVKIIKHRMKERRKADIPDAEVRETGFFQRRMRQLMDSERYGGAPLLGVDGLVLIGHGKSKSEAVYNGIRAGIRYHKAGLLTGIRQAYGPPES